MGALLSSRLARVSGVCLWGISVVVLALGVLHKAHRVNGNDFTMYLDAARALIAGRNPYTLGGTLPYMYPLFLAAVLGPLTAVPPDVATVVWFLASVASLLGAVWVIVGLARAEGVIRSDVPLTVPLVALWFLLFDPIQNNLLNGQINFQILLLCALSLRAYVGRRTLGSAWPLAAAIAVKLTPALLLGFLAIRRRWNAIVLCLGLSAAFVLAPIVFPGAQGGHAYRNFVHSVLLPRLHSEYPAHRGVRFSVNGALGALVPAWDQALWRRAVGASLPLLGLAAVEILSRRRRTAGRGALDLRPLSPCAAADHPALRGPPSRLRCSGGRATRLSARSRQNPSLGPGFVSPVSPPPGFCSPAGGSTATGPTSSWLSA